MSNYPDDFRGPLPGERAPRGDDLDDAIELNSDFDALFAIDEARTAYREAIAKARRYLSPAATLMVAEYLERELNAYHEEGVAGRLQAATEVDL